MAISTRARSLALGAACLVLGAAFGPTLASAANEKIQDVFVRNTDADPVPTKAIGTTQVAGTVGISGTPVVSVAGTSDVRVSNTEPIRVTEVTGSATTPFARSIFVEFGGTSFDTASFTVPAGKQLRIELFTFQELNIGAGLSGLHLIVTSGGNRVRHFLQVPAESNLETNTLTQQLAIVADPGSEVTLDAFLVQPIGSESAVFGMGATFAGTLTDT